MDIRRQIVPSRGWSEREVVLAAQIFRESIGMRNSQIMRAIAAKLRRSMGSVEARFGLFGPSFINPRGNLHPDTANQGTWIVPRRILEERDERMMLEPQSLTAMLMGDPLPGRSALDRVQQKDLGGLATSALNRPERFLRP